MMTKKTTGWIANFVPNNAEKCIFAKKISVVVPDGF